jgi:hypothetical protein
MKKIAAFIFLPFFFLFSCKFNSIRTGSTEDTFILTGSPFNINLELDRQQLDAAAQYRLVFVNHEIKADTIPVQLGSGENQVIAIFPQVSPCKYEITETGTPYHFSVTVIPDSTTGQYKFLEDGRLVLQYNYNTVFEKDVIRLGNKESSPLEFSEVTGVYLEEFLKENPHARRDSAYTTSIYSIPRSDYIHPLYGLNGEMLTRDWPDGGHPHHRGIFWAWPEVELGSQRGDLYALQRVFARPTGKVEATDGPVFAQLVAENLWMWDDEEPIVRETAAIRVFRKAAGSRIIDISIKLEALKDSITIATRGTNSYGAFNLRMQSPDSQNISHHTDEQGSVPLRSWADFSGVFHGEHSPSGVMVLQYGKNPEYPGPWQEYPDLSWIQPVFPSHGTRYPIRKDNPLILRYRLIVHTGAKPGRYISEKRWDAFNSVLTPLYDFGNGK